MWNGPALRVLPMAVAVILLVSYAAYADSGVTSAVSSTSSSTTKQPQDMSSASQSGNTTSLGTTTASQSQPTDGVTIGNSSSIYAIDGNSERKVLQADGLTWAFYSDGENLVYQTSGNGSSWSNPTVVRPQTIGYHFSVWYDQGSNTVYYVSVDSENSPAPATSTNSSGECQETTVSLNSTAGSTETLQCLVSGFYYRWGTLTENGSIQWSIPEGYVQTGTYAANPEIFGRGNDVWVSLQTNDGADIEVWNFNNGTWSRVDDIPTPDGYISIVLPLPTGYALVYAIGGLHVSPRFSQVTVITTTNDGATWSAPVSTSGNYSRENAVAVGDTIYFTGIDNASNVVFWSYDANTSTMSPVQVIASGYSFPYISTDGVSRLIIAYSDNSSVYLVESTNLGASWSQQVLVGASSSGVSPPSAIPYEFSGSSVPVCWLAGSETGTYPLECSVAPLNDTG